MPLGYAAGTAQTTWGLFFNDRLRAGASRRRMPTILGVRLRGRSVTAGVVALLVALSGTLVSPAASRAASDVSSDPCDWPMWGRTITREFATECPGLSPQNASDLKRIWFFNTYDVVTATPAVVGNRVYVGDWSGRFYALNRANGKKRWTYKIKPHPRVYAGQIVSSAAVATTDDGPTVFFGGGKTLYALNAKNGKLRWKHELPGPGGGADYTEIESSPVVVDDVVIVGFDVHNSPDLPAGVVALDAATGDVRWRTELAPTEGEGATAAGCADVWSSPSVDVERRSVFVGTGNCSSSPGGWGRLAEAIVALGLDDGAVKWTYQPHQPNNDDFDFAGAPNLFEADGRALVGLGNKDGSYYAVDRETGEEVWQTHATDAGLTDPGSNYSTGGFIGPTAVAGGIVVGGTAIGGSPFLHAMDTATGEIVWQQPEAAATYGAAAVANGVVVIGGTDFTLRALDLKTGDVLWSDAVSGAVSGGAAIVDDDVIAVAGIREPGVGSRSRTSGVYRYSLHGKPVTSTTTKRGKTKTPVTVTTLPGAGDQPCVAAPCNVDFDLIEPPAGLDPTLTLDIDLDPWRVKVTTTGLGDPEAWLRPGSNAARSGATRFGVFISESDDNPQGGLLCVLKDNGTCTSRKIPRVGASYNRITILAITDSNKLPTPQEGVNRLVVTRGFNPLLTPIPKKKENDD